MENLDRNLLKVKQDLLRKKKWKMKIYIPMMFQIVLNQKMDKYVINLKYNKQKEEVCHLIISQDIFFHILNK